MLNELLGFEQAVRVIKQNQFLIVMTGLYIGNYFSKSFLYDFLLDQGLSLTLVQTGNIAVLLCVHCFGWQSHVFLFDHLILLFLVSILLGIPGGSIYSSSLY
mmetsp:Transcript_14221/g.24188  ORF Transcript_14221/g.24188 Transcript_14221/m.24188 type:complete len:102 (-) Transcript_14221:224-529(-)